jgi:hypothetical protein
MAQLQEDQIGRSEVLAGWDVGSWRICLDLLTLMERVRMIQTARSEVVEEREGEQLLAKKEGR